MDDEQLRREKKALILGEAWHGQAENLIAGRQALYRRARCNGAASLGTYTDEMEETLVAAGDPAHRRGWRDD